MSAIERHPPMWDAFTRCTMRSAWARILRARSAGVTVSVLTVPGDGAPEAVHELGRRLPRGGAAKLRDVGLEVHDLVRLVGQLADAERQARVDRVADRLDDLEHGHGTPGAEIVHAVEPSGRHGLDYRQGGIFHVEIVPFLRSRGQFRPLPAEGGERGRRGAPAAGGRRAVAREEPRPRELRASPGGELPAEEAEAELDRAVERGRLRRAALVDPRLPGAVLGLRPESYPAPAPRPAGAREEREMRGQVPADLARVVVEAVADAFPGEVADDVRCRADDDPLGRWRFVQVGVHDRQPPTEIGDAPRLGAGTHHRGGVDSPGDEAARDVRAEEAGRPGEEDSHGPYSADGSKRRTRILMPENHVTVQAAHVVSGALLDRPTGRTASGDAGW